MVTRFVSRVLHCCLALAVQEDNDAWRRRPLRRAISATRRLERPRDVKLSTAPSSAKTWITASARSSSDDNRDRYCAVGAQLD